MTGRRGIRRGIREMRGTFFRESPPSPQRTCWKATEVRSCLAAFCLRQNFGVFCRGLKGMQASPFHPRAKSTGIFPAGENSVPRQGLKAFNLKAVFAYRANALVKPNARRTRSLYPKRLSSLGQAFREACGIQRQSLWSSPAGGENSFTAFLFA